MGFMPLDRFGLEELLPLIRDKKRRDEDARMSRLLMNKQRPESPEMSLTDRSSERRNAIADYKAMERAKMQMETEKDMQEARSVMSLAGDHMLNKTGLSGANALAMAQADMNRVDKGLYGSATRVTPSYGSRYRQSKESPYLSSAQADFVKAQTDSLKQRTASDKMKAEDQSFKSAFTPNLQSMIDQGVIPKGYQTTGQTPNVQNGDNTQELLDWKQNGGELTPQEASTLKKAGYNFNTPKPQKVDKFAVQQQEKDHELTMKLLDGVDDLTVKKTIDGKTVEVPLSEEDKQNVWLGIDAMKKAGKSASEIQIKIKQQLWKLRNKY